MNKLCTSIQEKILFKELLLEAETKHVKTCPDCMSAAFENQQLLESFQSAKDFQVSDHFAENVMHQIYKTQIEAGRKLSFKDYFLLSRSFKTALFALLFMFPLIAGTI